jgi:hypothetical protein
MHAGIQGFHKLFPVELILHEAATFSFRNDVEVAVFLRIFALCDDDVFGLHHLQIHRRDYFGDQTDALAENPVCLQGSFE